MKEGGGGEGGGEKGRGGGFLSLSLAGPLGVTLTFIELS